MKKGVPAESGVGEGPPVTLPYPFLAKALLSLGREGVCVLGVGGGAQHASLSRVRGFLDARKSPVAFADNAAGISWAIALLLRNCIF